MTEAQDKYAHLFPEDELKKRREKQVTQPQAEKPQVTRNMPKIRIPMGWFNSDKMYAVALLTFAHGLIQSILIAAMLVIVVLYITGTSSSKTQAFVFLGCAIGIIITRVLFEAAIVLFRIYEEICLTRRGIDDFNAKVQARSK